MQNEVKLKDQNCSFKTWKSKWHNCETWGA